MNSGRKNIELISLDETNTSGKRGIHSALLSRNNKEPGPKGSLVPAPSARALGTIRPGSIGTFGPGSCLEPGPKGLHMRQQPWDPWQAPFGPGSSHEPGPKALPCLYHLPPELHHHF